VTAPAPAPVESRPVVLSCVCWGVGVFVVAVFAAVSVALGSGPQGEASFRLPDQIAMTGLGVLLGGAVVGFTRARVRADEGGIDVRNVLGWRRFPWQVVREVRLDEGTPWASLELQDDDTVALLGVSSNDGDRAVDTVLALRALLDASRRPGGAGPGPDETAAT
jgi:hypothetical protein